MRPIAELPSGFWWVGLTLLLVLTWCLTSFGLFLITTVRLTQRQLVFVCLWCVWLCQGHGTALRVKLSNSRTILNLWERINCSALQWMKLMEKRGLRYKLYMINRRKMGEVNMMLRVCNIAMSCWETLGPAIHVETTSHAPTAGQRDLPHLKHCSGMVYTRCSA